MLLAGSKAHVCMSSSPCQGGGCWEMSDCEELVLVEGREGGGGGGGPPEERQIIV